MWLENARVSQPRLPDSLMSAKATWKVSAAVMASRVLGLAREMMFAGIFGGSKWMDCFYLAFKVPNLLRDLFAEGALSQAFVTTFSKKLKTEGEESAWALAHKMMTLAAVFMSLVTVIGMVAAPWIVDLLTSFSRGGNSPRVYDPEEIALTVTMVRVMYPFILLVSLAALVMGMLNARNVFGMPALSSCFFNLGSMIGGAAIGYWMDPAWGPQSLVGFSIGVVIGGRFQLARLGRPADFKTHGASRDRRIGRADQCGGQCDVRVWRGRGRGELAELCIPAHAITDRRLRGGGSHGDTTRTFTGGGRWNR
jgi:murein biosynthesis integral membrane protein MurJ